jgi:hypothetical protein
VALCHLCMTHVFDDKMRSMPASKNCTECGTGRSVNRNGRPGRCEECINALYIQSGWQPLDRHTGARRPRRCACLDCGQIDQVAYAEIRDAFGHRCLWCRCRRVYEHGLASEPNKWDISVENAAQIVLAGGYTAEGKDGGVLKAAGLATRMKQVWTPVEVVCAGCGVKAMRSASMTLASTLFPEYSDCFHCFAKSVTVEHEQIYEAYGLIRNHRGYAKIGEKVAARCMYCGAERPVSLADLKRGIAPCLDCAGSPDPDAPHVVYQMHFPRLRVRKVGIANKESRHDRVASHVAHGGVLLEIHDVPNREAALAVEHFVLNSVEGFASDCTVRDFPQGGYTETWSDDAPEVKLGEIIGKLASEEAPGFDRLGKLKAYFDGDPAAIDELAPFVQVQPVDVDGGTVYVVDFSEPQEQVLRKIRAHRTTRSAGAPENTRGERTSTGPRDPDEGRESGQPVH